MKRILVLGLAMVSSMILHGACPSSKQEYVVPPGAATESMRNMSPAGQAAPVRDADITPAAAVGLTRPTPPVTAATGIEADDEDDLSEIFGEELIEGPEGLEEEFEIEKYD